MKKINKTYYEGIYRKNQKGFGFVKLENQEEEIYISKENSQNALNGDKVQIEILEESNKIKNAEAKVVKILKHEKDTIVGIFQNNRNFGTDIFISKKDMGKARSNHKVLVKITKYPQNGKKAEGKIIEVIRKCKRSRSRYAITYKRIQSTISISETSSTRSKRKRK